MPNDNRPAPGPLIDDQHAAFLGAGVSIGVASRNSERLPSLTRGLGCRLAGDRSRLAVFVVAEQSRQLLDDIRGCRHVAAVFTHPLTQRSVQLKGRDGGIEALAAGDLDRLADYRRAYGDALGALGYDPKYVRALLDPGARDIVAVSFTPDAVFVQAPGHLAAVP